MFSTWNPVASSGRDEITMSRSVLRIPCTQSTVAFASRDIHIAYLGLQALPFVSLFFLLVFGRLHRFSYTPFLLALVVVVESLLLFFVPQAEAPKQITVDYAPITFLQKNLGQYRFMDFEVLYPNWGTYFGINELSDIDLPFPKAFKNFIETNLLPGLTPGNQFVAKGGRPTPHRRAGYCWPRPRREHCNRQHQ